MEKFKSGTQNFKLAKLGYTLKQFMREHRGCCANCGQECNTTLSKPPLIHDPIVSQYEKEGGLILQLLCYECHTKYKGKQGYMSQFR